METAVEQQQEQEEHPQTAEEARVAALPADAPPQVKKAAAGQTLDVEEEEGALDWFLGPTQRLEYDVTVQWETPKGFRPLTFHMRQVDGDKLQEIDESNRQGDGPFSKLDTQGFNAEAVVEACVYFSDVTGRKIKPTDEAFTGGMPNPVLAMRTRFKTQPGILEHLAERIREKAAFSADRVGGAQRSLVETGKP